MIFDLGKSEPRSQYDDAMHPVRRLLFRKAIALLIIGLFAGANAFPALASPTQQIEEPAYRYELVDTWEDEPWELRAGHVGRTADISSDSSNITYLLDDHHLGVHSFAPDGRILDFFALPNAGINATQWRPSRMDIGFDDHLYVLYVMRAYRDPETNRYVERWRVDRLDKNGQQLFSFNWRVDKLSTPRIGQYSDIALRKDGRIYVSRHSIDLRYIFVPCEMFEVTIKFPDSGVDIFSPAGEYLETIEFRENRAPAALDISEEDDIYVINAVPAENAIRIGCPPGPGDPPSLSRDESADQLTEIPEPWDAGVVIFSPDHRAVDFVPFFNGQDIAVGEVGVFISRNVEIFQLRDMEPLYAGPTGAVLTPYYFKPTVFSLDVSRDDRVNAGMQHCYFMGALMFDNPGARQDVPRFAGFTDAPELEGPIFPMRLSASEDLAVLLGRYNYLGVRPNRRYTPVGVRTLPQSVQRWTRHGEVVPPSSPMQAQMGVCASTGLNWYTQDVAIDQTAVYSIDYAQLHRRPHDYLPEWTTWPGILSDPEGNSRLTKVAADSRRVAVFDEASFKVHIVDDESEEVASWEISDSQNAVPVDIAMHEDRVYLADRGQNRVLVRTLFGQDLGDWGTSDGPLSIASGPDGDVFILGRGKWIYRYSPLGELRAAWPVPEPELDILDIAVDEDGKVYVSFTDVDQDPFNPNGTVFSRNGIWIFEGEAYIRPPSPKPDPGACLGIPDKWAEPYRIPLGDTVDVSLSVEGHCPGTQLPLQMVIVFDTSRSMNFDNTIEAAKNAVTSMLGELDPNTAEAALITFDNGATLVQQLTSDLAAVSRRVSALDALGDTRSTAGLSAALRELQGPRAKPSERQIVLFVTDGALKDEPSRDALELRMAGIDIYALVTPSREYIQGLHLPMLENLVGGDPSRVFVNPNPLATRELALDVSGYRETEGLWETITIVDEIPDNMTYIRGSAVPTAAYNEATHSLTWVFSNIMAAEKLEMTYKLRPEEVGIWPTNVQAVADYRDALDNDGQLIFPIPEVEVWAPPPKDHFVYLPFGANRTCVPSDKPLDIVLVMDTSSSMREPAASGNGTKLDAAREAAGSFLGNLSFGERRDKAAIVSFNLEASRVVDLTADRAALIDGLARLESVQGTRIDLGLEKAREALLAGKRADAKPVVILLTDGLQNLDKAPNSAVITQADALKDLGTFIYTIGLGNQIDIALLEAAASSADRFYRSPSSDQLADIYAQISERITCDLQDGG